MKRPYTAFVRVLVPLPTIHGRRAGLGSEPSFRENKQTLSALGHYVHQQVQSLSNVLRRRSDAVIPVFSPDVLDQAYGAGSPWLVYISAPGCMYPRNDLSLYAESQ
jgi:hypothetical protein